MPTQVSIIANKTRAVNQLNNTANNPTIGTIMAPLVGLRRRRHPPKDQTRHTDTAATNRGHPHAIRRKLGRQGGWPDGYQGATPWTPRAAARGPAAAPPAPPAASLVPLGGRPFRSSFVTSVQGAGQRVTWWLAAGGAGLAGSREGPGQRSGPAVVTSGSKGSGWSRSPAGAGMGGDPSRSPGGAPYRRPEPPARAGICRTGCAGLHPAAGPGSNGTLPGWSGRQRRPATVTRSEPHPSARVTGDRLTGRVPTRVSHGHP